ncbi:Hypothetical_protein [Hexamita inflata]|uniref:Hypothetical_protein n=1 Tax=Hexamita inflata TaxID=28002 RepID=A0AA86NDE4_9EUKA|nr:Hypothetical protein HINF_LOCUS4901 [Hexamita inflata]
MSNNQAIQQFQNITKLNNPQVIRMYMQETNNQVELAVAIYNKNFEDFVDIIKASDEQARRYLNQHYEVADAVNALQKSGEEIVPRKKIYRYHQTDEQVQKHIAYFRDYFSTSQEIATQYLKDAYFDITIAIKKYQQDQNKLQKINCIENKPQFIQFLKQSREQQNMYQKQCNSQNNKNEDQCIKNCKDKVQINDQSQGYNTIIVQIKNTDESIDLLEQKLGINKNMFIKDYSTKRINGQLVLLCIKVYNKYYTQICNILMELSASQITEYIQTISKQVIQQSSTIDDLQKKLEEQEITNAENTEKINHYQQQKRQADANNRKLNSKITQLNEQIEEMQNEIAEQSNQKDSYKTHNEQLHNELQQYNHRCQQLQSQLNQVSNQLSFALPKYQQLQQISIQQNNQLFQTQYQFNISQQVQLQQSQMLCQSQQLIYQYQNPVPNPPYIVNNIPFINQFQGNQTDQNQTK